ncbi:hypothetical protein TNIN_100481 [Trichonephila inaurata madagascariensis]|uniref:Uncharacterized protein n=1 Tax=Trichonephila inaurata madagascariensis TaxID=2747483 RepID=A0A8X6Y969_9ARAC|nr:hypothetical protein TNIN_100481 [Trichonephila inaurata madagascariensis]
MAACRPKRVVSSDEIDKFLTNKEPGDEFSYANSDDEVGNNRQKQDLLYSMRHIKTFRANRDKYEAIPIHEFEYER